MSRTKIRRISWGLVPALFLLAAAVWPAAPAGAQADPGSGGTMTSPAAQAEPLTRGIASPEMTRGCAFLSPCVVSLDSGTWELDYGGPGTYLERELGLLDES